MNAEADMENIKSAEAKQTAKENFAHDAVDLTNMAVGPGLASLPGMDFVQIHTKNMTF